MCAAVGKSDDELSSTLPLAYSLDLLHTLAVFQSKVCFVYVDNAHMDILYAGAHDR